MQIKRFNDANEDIYGCKLKGLVMQKKDIYWILMQIKRFTDANIKDFYDAMIRYLLIQIKKI